MQKTLVKGIRKDWKRAKKKPKLIDTCHQKKYWSNHCPNVLNKRKISEESANLIVNSLYLIGNYKVGKVIIAVVGNIEAAGIYLDCDTTSHMFTDWAQFISHKEIINVHIIIGSNNKVTVIGTELVSFRARVLKGYLDIVLNNVLYIPHLGASLISMRTLQWDGN